MLNNAYPTQLPSFPMSAAETLTEGITLQWLFGKMAVAFTVENTDPRAIYAWIERRQQLALAWPARMPFFELIDLSSKSITVTPYMWKQVRTIHRILHAVPTRAAIVIQQDGWLFQQMVQTFVQVCAMDGIDMQIETFTERSAALHWVKHQIETYTRTQR
jgi:hypothetical protein